MTIISGCDRKADDAAAYVIGGYNIVEQKLDGEGKEVIPSTGHGPDAVMCMLSGSARVLADPIASRCLPLLDTIIV